jgi:hypothetical protein
MVLEQIWMSIDLPPIRFDHPYRDGPVIELVLPMEKLQPVCIRLAGALSGKDWYWGCSYKVLTTCHVFLGQTDKIDQIRRHEHGHCNGWSKLHEP